MHMYPSRELPLLDYRLVNQPARILLASFDKFNFHVLIVGRPITVLEFHVKNYDDDDDDEEDEC